MDRDAIRLELVKLIYSPHIRGELDPADQTIHLAQKLEKFVVGSPEPTIQEPEVAPPRRQGSRR